jgi:hypothetical protein
MSSVYSRLPSRLVTYCEHGSYRSTDLGRLDRFPGHCYLPPRCGDEAREERLYGRKLPKTTFV